MRRADIRLTLVFDADCSADVEICVLYDQDKEQNTVKTFKDESFIEGQSKTLKVKGITINLPLGAVLVSTISVTTSGPVQKFEIFNAKAGRFLRRRGTRKTFSFFTAELEVIDTTPTPFKLVLEPFMKGFKGTYLMRKPSTSLKLFSLPRDFRGGLSHIETKGKRVYSSSIQSKTRNPVFERVPLFPSDYMDSNILAAVLYLEGKEETSPYGYSFFGFVSADASDLEDGAVEFVPVRRFGREVVEAGKSLVWLDFKGTPHEDRTKAPRLYLRVTDKIRMARMEELLSDGQVEFVPVLGFDFTIVGGHYTRKNSINYYNPKTGTGWLYQVLMKMSEYLFGISEEIYPFGYGGYIGRKKPSIFSLNSDPLDPVARSTQQLLGFYTEALKYIKLGYEVDPVEIVKAGISMAKVCKERNMRSFVPIIIFCFDDRPLGVVNELKRRMDKNYKLPVMLVMLGVRREFDDETGESEVAAATTEAGTDSTSGSSSGGSDSDSDRSTSSSGDTSSGSDRTDSTEEWPLKSSTCGGAARGRPVEFTNLRTISSSLKRKDLAVFLEVAGDGFDAAALHEVIKEGYNEFLEV